MAAPVRILFAGGGTGGHLYPAIAIADELRRRVPGAEIGFIGNKEKLESRVVPERGYRFFPITVAGFPRSLSLAAVAAAGKLIVALWQSFRILRRERPDVVVGTGGYVCGPPLFIAWLRGMATLIQEQNSYPGITTRLLASKAREVHLSFERSRTYLRRTEGVYLSGNPTRGAIGSIARREGSARFNLDPDRFTLLAVGGSRGARSINEALLSIVRELVAIGVQVIWLTGTEDVERISSAPEARGAAVSVRAFLDEMEYAYAAADVVLCRAGATTLAEVTRAGLPSILVPYPFAAADHQRLNAEPLKDAGAALIIDDAEIKEKLLPAVAELLRDPARRKAMGERALTLGYPRATEHLADAVLRLAGGTRA